MNKKEYSEYVSKTSPKSKHFSTMFAAFWVGGLICCIGQSIFDTIQALLPLVPDDDIWAITTLVMIFLGSTLTALGVYDKIGRYAGGGSIIPITGFANSVTSPAMEYKREGIIFGLMSKMFVIAGPIIVSGIAASVAVGICYYIVSLF